MTSNTQIDAYLMRKLTVFQLIPSQSYEGLFTTHGKWRPRILNPLMKHAALFLPKKPWCCVVNMDKLYGPGNHWVALFDCGPGKPLFYYDPLLPNKEYPLPTPLKHFLENQQEAGKQVVVNWDQDQSVFTLEPVSTSAEAELKEFRSGKVRMPNEMCGAYCVYVILAMDAEVAKNTKKLVESYYDIRAKGRKSEIQTIYQELRRS